MRICILLAFLCCLCLPVGAQGLIDFDNGILGFKLGAGADEMRGILKDGKQERLARYRPVDDSLRHEGILTRKVKLFFWEGKLHSIELKLEAAEADKMLLWLKDSYGDGKKEDAMGFRFTWEGSRVRVFWDQNLVTREASLTFMDDQIHAKYYKFMKSLE